jgi:DNA-binding transcriptional ArsR family regulator
LPQPPTSEGDLPGAASPSQNDELALIEAIRDPARAAILALLSDRAADPSEIAREVQQPLDRVRARLDSLRAAGLVGEASDPRHKDEGRYFLQSRQRLTEQRLAELAPPVRDQVLSYVMRLVATDIGRFVRSGLTYETRFPPTVRIRMEVDDRGWRDLTSFCDRINAQVETVKEKSTARLERLSGESPVIVSTTIAALEMPAGSVGRLPRHT